ncbi:hypothetical protein BDN72DRAFT_903192 [Pluteus cervinus]|uniref:Uncharacterized protein n=1 Tax=Pluteus cervinus TaxID=181527 RepID=A0ACD3A9Y3_9AGAR|nr:hypothetical protein BDN72DRAFT_903192 [Pluteus cervinus]
MDRSPPALHVPDKPSATSTNTNSLASFLEKIEQGAVLSSDDARRYLDVALASPPSDQRQEVLVKLGRSMSGRDPKSTTFLDLAILALETALENTSTTRFRVPPFFLCVLLFKRCTFPNNAPFMDKAFKFLQQHSASAIPQAAAGNLLLLILEVVQSQNPSRSEDLGIALQAVSEPIRSLANQPSLDLQAILTLMGWALLAAIRAPSSPHTLSLVDSAYPHLSLALPPAQHASYLMHRASVYACQSSRTDGPGFVAAIEAIEEARRSISTTDTSSVEVLCQAFTTLPILTPDNSQHIHLLYPFVQWATPLLQVDSPVHKWFLINRESVIMFHVRTLSPPSELGDDVPEEWIHLILYCATCMTSPVELDAQDISFIRSQILQTRSDVIRVPRVQMREYPAGAVQLMANAVAHSILQTEPSASLHVLLSCVFAAFVARAMEVPAAMHAYRYVMANLHTAIDLMLPIAMRYRMDRVVLRIIPDAVSYATELDRHDLALEWADQGRAMIWGQLLHLRFPYSAELPDTLAEQWADATTQMNTSQTIEVPSEPASFDLESFQLRSHTARRLQTLIMEIKKLNNPKFNLFFGGKTFEDIRSTAAILGGPIIFLNVNRYASSALAVVPTIESVIHIPLPSIDYKVLTAIQTLFSQYIASGGRGEEFTLERIGKPVKAPDPPPIPPHAFLSFLEVLRYLWVYIVKPVLDVLKIKPSSPESSEQLPRVWWSTSGPLSSLPIHAAGEYDKDEFENKTSDYVVSSYMPSTSTILYATRSEEEKPKSFHLLAVANPEGCGLPGTEGDLEAINTYVPNSQVTELSKTEATVKANRHLTVPSILANHARLTLTEITKLSLPHAEFAFLSACQTAQGTDDNPSESAHLAAGMLVAGYRSVIGSMWNVRDDCAPQVAREVYKRLFENGKPDYRRAAYALHDAVQALRKEPGVSFGLWVPFIHLGV